MNSPRALARRPVTAGTKLTGTRQPTARSRRARPRTPPGKARSSPDADVRFPLPGRGHGSGLPGNFRALVAAGRRPEPQPDCGGETERLVDNRGARPERPDQSQEVGGIPVQPHGALTMSGNSVLFAEEVVSFPYVWRRILTSRPFTAPRSWEPAGQRFEVAHSKDGKDREDDRTNLQESSKRLDKNCPSRRRAPFPDRRLSTSHRPRPTGQAKPCS